MWPDLLLQDQRVPSCSLFMGTYHTSLSSGNYGISDCAAELMASLKRVDSNGRRAPIEKKHIAFICHSLGGIVVRHMVDYYSDEFESHKIGLALIASPSLGSDYAKSLSAFAGFFRNRVGQDLRPGSQALEELDRRFMRFLERRPAGSFFGVEAIEHHSIFLLKFLPDFKPIVSSASAGRYFQNSKRIPGTNHSTIVKPSGLDHPSHDFIVDFFSAEIFKGTGQVAVSKNQYLIDPTEALFDFYDPSVEKFYLERAADQELNACSKLGSVWVAGPSGAGKTCALRRLSASQYEKTVEVCLAQCFSDDSRTEIVAEMLDTLRQFGYVQAVAESDSPYQVLVNSLVSVANGPVTVVVSIDEVPIGNGRSTINSLLSLAFDLLVAVSQRGRRGLRFFISSIYHPDFDLLDGRDKFMEKVQLVEFVPWSDAELLALFEIACEALPGLKGCDRNALVARSAGNPRELKKMLREYVRFGEVAPVDGVVCIGSVS